jgi:hypothetical protein
MESLISYSDHASELDAAYLASSVMKDRASLPKPPKVSTINGINLAPSAAARAANLRRLRWAAATVDLSGP